MDELLKKSYRLFRSVSKMSFCLHYSDEMFRQLRRHDLMSPNGRVRAPVFPLKWPGTARRSAALPATPSPARPLPTGSLTDTRAGAAGRGRVTTGTRRPLRARPTGDGRSRPSAFVSESGIHGERGRGLRLD